MSNLERKEPTISDIKKDEQLATPAAEGAVAVSNDNAAVAQAPEKKAEAPAATPKQYSKGKRILSAIFTAAAGAGATATAKAAVGLVAASFAVPALATLIASSIAVGVAAAVVSHIGQNHVRKKRGEEKVKFLSKKSAKVFLTSSLFAVIGGAIFLGFDDIKSAAANVFDFAKPETVAAVAPAAPIEQVVVTAAPTALDRVSDLAAASSVSADVKLALARAASENTHVAAQATKDLAFYSYNGLGGLPENHSLAVELFNKAAEAGNVQAKVDIAYLQYYGLDGVAADKTAALASVSELHTAKAEMFARAWSAGVKAVAPAVAVPAA